MNNKNIAKVTKFLTTEYKRGMGDISILRNPDGTYDFFDRYHITESKLGFVVTTTYSDVPITFSSLKCASAWCIFDSQNNFNRAKRIENLDMMISSTEVSIDIHKRMLKKSKDVENTLIHIAKLNEEKLKKSTLSKELAGYIEDSKYLQTKKFAAKR